MNRLIRAVALKAVADKMGLKTDVALNTEASSLVAGLADVVQKGIQDALNLCQEGLDHMRETGQLPEGPRIELKDALDIGFKQQGLGMHGQQGYVPGSAILEVNGTFYEWNQTFGCYWSVEGAPKVLMAAEYQAYANKTE